MATGGSITVLFAEEKSWLRELFRPTLMMLGCDVVAEASCHAEAVKLYSEHRPDLILTNFRLSVGTGLDVLQDVQAINPTAKVVLLTTHDDEHIRRQCMDAGASGFIVKNRPIEDFIAALAEHLPVPAAA
jgi:two-component system chemotaxis response regulator CheY